ncbi:MAG TPA: SPFH domain-containing protein [Salinivirgaceae bacterium]|nr:SPFH domain-containing protein [Salinivirgaceae bacterium]
MKTQEQNFDNTKISGILMLLVNLTMIVLSIFVLVRSVSQPYDETFQIVGIVGAILLFILTFIFWFGFLLIEPNEAVVMLFFGKYSGTIKENGFFWVNPFYNKKRLTLRARNLDAEPIKVNDKTGNPIMIGLVAVWRISDTYKASFHVDNASMSMNTASTGIVKLNEKMAAYENFVKIQCNAALRKVAGLYAYDQTGADSESDLTLRSNGTEINQILEKEINERLSIAGIEVIEARINYLAYAPEIAAVMLRRQQADAIIAAREKIVEGAVGMVQLALKQLSEKNIIDLDDDKRAAMVSNLMVVLCSEESTTPVINTGTLHN